jgi:hypothetical protein
MIADGQAIVHFLADHYENEIAQYLHPFWYKYYSYLSDHYAQIDSYVLSSHQWMDQVTHLSASCHDRFFFYSKLPMLSEQEKAAFLSSIHNRIEDDIALGVCLPHALSHTQQVLGLWENTTGDHMKLHVRRHDIEFGFVVVDDQLFFERPAQADDSKRHIYHLKQVKEETVQYLLKNPHLQAPKLLQSYFLL